MHDKFHTPTTHRHDDTSALIIALRDDGQFHDNSNETPAGGDHAPQMWDV